MIFNVEAAIKIALEEFMEKIKQSGAVFQTNIDSQPSQFSFTDLSAHLFSAFASNDCSLPLFLDQNSLDNDPYFLSDQPYRSNNEQQIHVPPGSFVFFLKQRMNVELLSTWNRI